MSNEEINQAKERYSQIVIGKSLSKDMKDHIIQGFGVSELSPNNFELYVIGQNLNHSSHFLHKLLSDWLRDNNEY